MGSLPGLQHPNSSRAGRSQHTNQARAVQVIFHTLSSDKQLQQLRFFKSFQSLTLSHISHRSFSISHFWVRRPCMIPGSRDWYWNLSNARFLSHSSSKKLWRMPFEVSTCSKFECSKPSSVYIYGIIPSYMWHTVRNFQSTCDLTSTPLLNWLCPILFCSNQRLEARLKVLKGNGWQMAPPKMFKLWSKPSLGHLSAGNVGSQHTESHRPTVETRLLVTRAFLLVAIGVAPPQPEAEEATMTLTMTRLTFAMFLQSSTFQVSHTKHHKTSREHTATASATRCTSASGETGGDAAASALAMSKAVPKAAGGWTQMARQPAPEQQEQQEQQMQICRSEQYQSTSST